MAHFICIPFLSSLLLQDCIQMLCSLVCIMKYLPQAVDTVVGKSKFETASLTWRFMMFAMLFILETPWTTHEKCSSILPKEQATEVGMDHLGPSPIPPPVGRGRDSWEPTVTFSLWTLLEASSWQGFPVCVLWSSDPCPQESFYISLMSDRVLASPEVIFNYKCLKQPERKFLP